MNNEFEDTYGLTVEEFKSRYGQGLGDKLAEQFANYQSITVASHSDLVRIREYLVRRMEKRQK